MLKNNILKPIIVATEKYVEYYQTGQSATPPPLDEIAEEKGEEASGEPLD